jgi:alanine racemase
MKKLPDKLRWVEISKSALINNVTIIRDHLSPNTQLASIVKSNAYGHGLKEVVGVIDTLSDAYGIVELSAARELRNLKINKRIMNIGTTLSFDVDEVIALSITPVIYSIEIANSLQYAAKKANVKIDVVVKIETGMNRAGLIGNELKELVAHLKDCDNLSLIGFSTHLAKSDEEESEHTLEQIKRFDSIREEYIAQGLNLDYSHTANTGASLRYTKSHYNIVRCGIGIYGLAPSNYIKKTKAEHFIQALEYKSRVVQIHKVKKGVTVGYGGTWSPKCDAKVAIIPVGYADGYSRLLSNNGDVVINGKKAPVVGRICMNCFTVDVTNIPTVKVDDEVTLISREPKYKITVDDIAMRINTINYEVTTVIPARVSRMVVP